MPEFKPLNVNQAPAMQRRVQNQQTARQEDPKAVINTALESLQQLPKDVQKDLAPSLIRAQMLAERRGR